MLGNCCSSRLVSFHGSVCLALRLSRRFYPTAPRRFYKRTTVLQNENSYEVALDHRKLKTPAGNLFTVRSEPLAIAVATEFDQQKEFVERPKMHLSALCFTAIDNPARLTKADMANYVVSYLDTDTVLFQSDGERDLYELQCCEWDPLIDWFNKRYETDLMKTANITPPQISERDKKIVQKYLQSYDEHVLHGIVYAVDTLKSVILAFATIDQRLEVEQAARLSCLEEEYQARTWGRVEWAHDLGHQEMQARLAAAVIFVHLNRADSSLKQKATTT